MRRETRLMNGKTGFVNLLNCAASDATCHSHSFGNSCGSRQMCAEAALVNLILRPQASGKLVPPFA